MATTQKQKTASGGNVAGLLSAALPGSRGGVGSAAIMRACLKVPRPSSSSRPAIACSPSSLLLSPKGWQSHTFLVVTPSGVIDITQQIGSWSIGIQLDAAGRFVVGSHGLTAGGSVDGKLSLAKKAQAGAPAVRVGSETGTRMEVGGIGITGEFNPDPAHLNYGLLVEADSAAITAQFLKTA